MGLGVPNYTKNTILKVYTMNKTSKHKFEAKAFIARDADGLIPLWCYVVRNHRNNKCYVKLLPDMDDELFVKFYMDDVADKGHEFNSFLNSVEFLKEVVQK